MQTIGNAENSLRFSGSVDHCFALRKRSSHRFFAEHALARLQRADRVIRVHGIGQHNVGDIDSAVVFNTLEVFIAVNRLRIDAIGAGDLPGLLGMSADQRRRIGRLADPEGGKNL